MCFGKLLSLLHVVCSNDEHNVTKSNSLTDINHSSSMSRTERRRDRVTAEWYKSVSVLGPGPVLLTYYSCTNMRQCDI